MSLGQKTSSVRTGKKSLTSASKKEVQKNKFVLEKIELNFARENRKIDLLSADDVLILSKIQRLAQKKASLSRGDIIHAFTSANHKFKLPASTVFSGIATCARTGLVETAASDQTNRLIGRPIQTIKPTSFCDQYLTKLVELTEILENAMAAQFSEKRLN